MSSHQCLECGKTFDRKNSLERHSWTHSQTTPFQCEYCGSYFTQKMSLERHLLTHDHEYPYNCSLCAVLRFRTQEDLEKHQETCKGKQFKCDLCPATFSSRSGMWAHINSQHPTIFRFQCAHCNRSPFLSQEIFESHFKKRHKNLEKGEFKKVYEFGRKEWRELVVIDGKTTWKAVGKVESKTAKKQKEREAAKKSTKKSSEVQPTPPLVNEPTPPLPPVPPFLIDQQHLQGFQVPWFPSMSPADNNYNGHINFMEPAQMALEGSLDFGQEKAMESLFSTMPPDNNSNTDNHQASADFLCFDQLPSADANADPLLFEEMEFHTNRSENFATSDSAPLSVQRPQSLEPSSDAFNPDEEMWFNPGSFARSETEHNPYSPSPASPTQSSSYEEEDLFDGII